MNAMAMKRQTKEDGSRYEISIIGLVGEHPISPQRKGQRKQVLLEQNSKGQPCLFFSA